MKEIPFLFLMTLAALPQTRAAEMERMVAALGYGRIVGFVHAVLPSLYRQLRLPVLAVLAFSTSVVDVALILGPTTPAPLAVRVIDWQHDPDLARHFVAAAGAVLQVGDHGACALRLACWRSAIGANAVPGDGAFRLARAPRRIVAPRRLAPLMAPVRRGGFRRPRLLALWSVAGAWRFPAALPRRPDARDLDAARRRFRHGACATRSRSPAFRASPRRCSRSARSKVLRALGSRHRSAALRALYVPLIAPQVAFLFGLQILFTYAGFDGTFAAVALAHLVFVFPYVLLSLSDPWRAWDPRFGLAIRALGHGENAVFWRVRLPMLLRPVLTAAALGFAVSVALYLPTLLVGGGRWPTVTTEAVALASGGDPG